MKRRKILFVEQNVDGTIGGSHYCLLYLVQKLNRNIYEPIIAFYEPNQLMGLFSKEGKTIVFNKAKNVTFDNMVLRKLINILINMIFVFRCIFFLLKNKINLVHLNNSVAVGYDTWLVACLITGVPCITHERNFDRFDRLRLPLFKILSSRYKKVLTVSDVIRDNLISQGFDPKIVETVYDGIDAEKYRQRVSRTRDEILKEFGIDQSSYLIGLIGNIREWKGQELLIDSLDIINKQVSNIVCLLIGDVSKNSDEDLKFKDKLVKKIDQYGLEEKIIFTGYRSDVPDLVNALDVQINASIKPDPFPHVILEGMSLGKVVIATNLGGAIESIDNGRSGFLVTATQPQDLAEKIITVLRDDKLRKSMSENAKERIKIFSMENNLINTEKIYKAML